MGRFKHECPHCEKRCGNAGGLTMHLRKCKPPPPPPKVSREGYIGQDYFQKLGGDHSKVRVGDKLTLTKVVVVREIIRTEGADTQFHFDKVSHVWGKDE